MLRKILALLILIIPLSVYAGYNDIYVADIQYDWINKNEVEKEAIISEVRDIIFESPIEKRTDLKSLFADKLKDKNQLLLKEILFKSNSNDNGLSWSSPSYLVSFNVNSGDTILFKGNMIPTNNSDRNLYGIGTFSGSTTIFEVQGNIMSLLYGDNFIGQTDLTNKKYAFSQLFRNTSVISAENLVLPATTLVGNCYEYMFYSCLRLTTAPKLPATTLATDCYKGMFSGCRFLTTAPQLPATTLAYRCYDVMFRDCISLVQAPELLATTLVDGCYDGMLYGCSSLNYIKMLATDITANDCLSSWVYGVANRGTFVKAASMTSLPSGFSGIPENWTVQNA